MAPLLARVQKILVIIAVMVLGFGIAVVLDLLFPELKLSPWLVLAALVMFFSVLGAFSLLVLAANNPREAGTGVQWETGFLPSC